nr:hypothetical protein BaRGS_029277 [Batillaria attramentaria]
MVTDSSKDVQEMRETLSKLKNLKEDDKNEAGMLRSRIDEQSRLIMVLKQRADEEIIRAQTLDRVNKELIEFRDHADDLLKNELRKYNILEGRFQHLATNHEEMIKIKDEYKRVNQELREENARIKSENARLFSRAIQDKDARIQELEKKFATMREQNSNMEAKLRQMQQDWHGREDGLKQQLRHVTETSTAEIKDLQHRLQESEERLKSASHKLQSQQDSRHTLEQDLSSKMAALTKERDELLDLAMQRGKLIQKEQFENKKLLKKAEDAEKQVRAMQDKFDQEAAAVNTNLQVKKLRGELADAEDKYAEMERRTSSSLSSYLDDILQKNLCPITLQRDLATLRETLTQLGWIVNLQKSDLIPSQRFVHLDALTFSWTDIDAYVFPPFPLVAKIVSRLPLFQCDLTLIAPLRGVSLIELSKAVGWSQHTTFGRFYLRLPDSPLPADAVDH